MKFFVTGANGQLGYDVICELYHRNFEFVGSDKDQKFRSFYSNRIESTIILDNYVQLDIENKNDVSRTIEKYKPNVVIHCAAWTAVDLAEDSHNYKKVKSINANGTKNIAEICQKLNCKMIYISTDYVFDGKGDDPWDPDCKIFNPLNYYGKTKLEGEIEVINLLKKYFIVRIEWLFGMNGKNFVKTMLDLGEKNTEVKVVCDQFGTPTYSYDLSKLLIDMSETDKYGIYHITNEGDYISWYEFCLEIYRQCGLKTKVIPITSDEYKFSVAIRPKNSRFDRKKLQKNNFNLLPPWKDALKRFLKEIKKIN